MSEHPGGPASEGARVVALGGGHGLAASLAALRQVAGEITAVVTVADNGGSSGRLRHEFGVLPPGDLRMALAALCDDDDWGRTWAEVLQHRFRSTGDLDGHATGNLLIVTLWDLLGQHVLGLDWVGRLLGARGRVLPMAVTPIDITALVSGLDPARPDDLAAVRGQVEVASTSGRVRSVRLHPEDPQACPEAVAAIEQADWVVLGPGSWYTSVIPHLLVPGLREALLRTRARILVNLNLVDQPGETAGLGPADHVGVLLEHAPGLRVDVVLADRDGLLESGDHAVLERVVRGHGGRLVLDLVARTDRRDQHDPERLAAAYARLLTAT